MTFIFTFYILSKRRELHTHKFTASQSRKLESSGNLLVLRMLSGISLRVECLISFQTCENLAYYKSEAARRTLVLLLEESSLWSLRDEKLQHMLLEPNPSLFLHTKAKRSLTTKESSYIRMNNPVSVPVKEGKTISVVRKLQSSVTETCVMLR